MLRVATLAKTALSVLSTTVQYSNKSSVGIVRMLRLERERRPVSPSVAPWWRILFTLLLISLLYAGSSGASDVTGEESFKGWSCDDILAPDLCPLTVHTDTLHVRGINVRYWKYALQNDTDLSPKLPIIILHGGPSYPHNYLLPLKKLACDGRDVIFYDQGGCSESHLPAGGSQSVKKDYPWLLDPNYYALEELPSLLKHLGIYRYHILGHSWGTMLAQLFALDASSSERDGLASMVLSGCISDSQLYIQEQWNEDTGSLGTLPPFVQQRIKQLEHQKAYDSPEYKALDDVLTTFFTCRTAPLPDCFLEAAANVNLEIYVGMQGASEFTVAGVLADFNTTGRLHELDKLPVLLTSGLYDTVRPKVVDVMHRNLALSERFLFRRSGHVSAIDEAVLMNKVVSDFFERVENSFHLQGGFVPQKSTSTTFVEQEEIASNSQITFNSVLWTVVAFVLGVLAMHFGGKRLATSSRRGYDGIHDTDPSVIAHSPP